MQPLLPFSLLKTSGSFCDKVYVYKDEAKGSIRYSHAIGYICETYVRGLSLGYWEEGMEYTLEFDGCKSNMVTKVNVKEISMTFGSTYKDGPTIEKTIGEGLLDYKKYTTGVSLTKEETLSLLPPNTSRSMFIIPVKVTLNVHSVYGNRLYRSPDFNYHERNASSTMAFLFGDGKTMFANLSFLSLYSHYFMALSHHVDDLPKEQESGLPLLELKHFKSRVFKTVLDILHPSIPSENEEFEPKRKDIPQILRLADFLSLEMVMIRMEHFIEQDCNGFYSSACQKLHWSIEYGMAGLMRSVIFRLWKFSDVEKLVNDPQFGDLPKEVMDLVLKRLMELIKEGKPFDFKSEPELNRVESEDSDEDDE